MGNCTCNRQDASRSRLIENRPSSRRNIEAPGFDVQARVSCTCARDALRAAGATQCQGDKDSVGAEKDAYATAETKLWLRNAADVDACTDDTDLFVEGLTDVGADAWHNPAVQVGIVTCKKGHPLVSLGTSRENGWVCSGRDEPGGCRSGINDFQQSDGLDRYRCEACDYDLCQECYRNLEATQEAKLRIRQDLEEGYTEADRSTGYTHSDETASLNLDSALDSISSADVKIIPELPDKFDASEPTKCNGNGHASIGATDLKSAQRTSLLSDEKRKVKSVRMSEDVIDNEQEPDPLRLRCSTSAESMASMAAAESAPVSFTPSELDEDSGSEIETEQEPMEMIRKRKVGVMAAPIEKGKFEPPEHKKDPATESKMRKALADCILFKSLNAEETSAIVGTMPVVNKKKGENIFRQGEMGDALFVVLSGTVDCYREAHLSGKPPKRDSPLAKHNDHQEKKPSTRSLKEISFVPSTTTSTSQSNLSKHHKGPQRTFIVTREDGAIFGELSIIFNQPRSLSVYAREAVSLGKLEGQVYQNLVVRRQMCVREKLEECLKKAKILETLDEEKIAKLADALELQAFKKDKPIISQGDEGKDFFIVHSGECVATIDTCGEAQEHCRYGPGDLFGELALLNKKPRAATITACTRVEVFKLSRRKFERMLGSMSMLQNMSYKTDPRKLIADFYRPGTEKGPRGSLEQHGLELEAECKSAWFAVFRPTSRDAVAKMLSGAGVGKGLNVKGKSAKKARLSGFVPFVQISDNNHKKDVEMMPKHSRVRVFYRTQASRDAAREAMAIYLNSIAEPETKKAKKKIKHKFTGASMELEGCDTGPQHTGSLAESECHTASTMGDGTPVTSQNLAEKVQEPFVIDEKFEPQVFGLNISGALLHEIYLMKPDLSPSVEWETGRKSEPAFMNMNLHAVCQHSRPEIVLFQHDEADPMNPRGLLIAYAEKTVKPVVSDFDAFLVASRNMHYQRLPKEQAELVNWCLSRVESVLKTPGSESWTTRWLGVLKEESDKGFHPHVPEFGFGDPTSISLIGDVVTHTAACGAVRHGAECFNFYFPQELDEDYLVVWEGFPAKPWEYVAEKELREFLLKRCEAGYRFPVNPVWPVRDPGWYEVLQALKRCSIETGDKEDTLDSWYPLESGILDQIERIHEAHPKGFSFRKSIFQESTHVGGSDISVGPTCRSVNEHVEMSLHQLQRNKDGGSNYRNTMAFNTPQTIRWFLGNVKSGKKTVVASSAKKKRWFLF